MKKVHIRKISWADWRELADMFRQIFQELTADEISRYIRYYDDMIGVAATDDGLVGFYQFGPKADGGVAWLNYLGVIPSCRSAGIGIQLLRDYEERAVEAGFHKAGLDVFQQNDRAMRFYEKCGYVRLGLVGDKFRYTKLLTTDPSATPSRMPPRTRPLMLARVYRRVLYIFLVDLPMRCRKPGT